MTAHAERGEMSVASRALLALGGAVLFWAAFPPLDFGWLAWGALAPWLVMACRGRARQTLFWGGLAAWAAFIALLHWLRFLSQGGAATGAWLGWWLLALYCAFYLIALMLLARWTRRRGVPLWLSAPALCLMLECLRGWMLTGFKFYFLGHTQHRFLPVIQIADAAGVAGISLLIALVNGCVAEIVLRRMEKRKFPVAAVVATALLLCACLGYGFFRLATSRFTDGPAVCLVQGNISQELKHAGSFDEARRTLSVYCDLTRRAAGKKVDLIVWPETMVPAEVELILDPPRLAELAAAHPNAKEWFDYLAWCGRELASTLRTADAHSFLGCEGKTPAGRSANSLVFVSPRGKVLGRYDKMHLVIFGEYVPLADTLPFLRMFRPEVMGPDLAAGQEAVALDLPTSAGAVRFGGTICYEDAEAGLWPRFVHEGGARFMVNATNDGWFMGSSELDHHLAVCVFRAVENRVPIARSANTGLTAIIAPDGRVSDLLPRDTADVLIGRLKLDSRRTLYSAWGDWLGVTGLLGGMALIVVSALPRRHRGHGGQREN